MAATTIDTGVHLDTNLEEPLLSRDETDPEEPSPSEDEPPTSETDAEEPARWAKTAALIRQLVCSGEFHKGWWLGFLLQTLAAIAATAATIYIMMHGWLVDHTRWLHAIFFLISQSWWFPILCVLIPSIQGGWGAAVVQKYVSGPHSRVPFSRQGIFVFIGVTCGNFSWGMFFDIYAGDSLPGLLFRLWAWLSICCLLCVCVVLDEEANRGGPARKLLPYRRRLPTEDRTTGKKSGCRILFR